jgi:hypothetical protein
MLLRCSVFPHDGGNAFIRNVYDTSLHGVTSRKIANFRKQVVIIIWVCVLTSVKDQ